jgi:hypothetical protein
MPKFAKAFGVRKLQAELDFVDVPLQTDAWLFIDPFAIGQRVDPWSQKCHGTLVAFFQAIVDRIRAGSLEEARERWPTYVNRMKLGLDYPKSVPPERVLALSRLSSSLMLSRIPRQ